jgi:hypothetical protein
LKKTFHFTLLPEQHSTEESDRSIRRRNVTLLIFENEHREIVSKMSAQSVKQNKKKNAFTRDNKKTSALKIYDFLACNFVHHKKMRKKERMLDGENLIFI